MCKRCSCLFELYPLLSSLTRTSGSHFPLYVFGFNAFSGWFLRYNCSYFLLEPINPYASRERRRRHLHSTSDDNKNAASNSNIVMASSSKEPLNQVDNKGNGTVSTEKDSSIRKKRHVRKHTPEQGGIIDSVIICKICFHFFILYMQYNM